MRIINFFDGFQSQTTPLVQPIPASDISVYPVPAIGLTEINVQAALEGIYMKHITLNSGVHGVSGSVVGTTDSQVISGKQFNQDLIPASSETFSLGTGGSKWKHLYLSGNAYIDGSLLVLGATAFFDTDALEFTGKLLTLNKNGNDTTAEGSGLYVERTGTAVKVIYDSSLTSKWKAGAAGSEKEIVTVSDIQALTNKTIDADSNTITNIDDGNIKIGAEINRAKLKTGTADHVIINDGLGVMSSEQYLNRTRGGTGITSTATFPASGVIVTRDASETLTNKTLYNPLISGNNIDLVIPLTFSFLPSLGTNICNIGAATSTIVIPGNLTVNGTATYINTEDLNVEDKNITCNFSGNQAAMEGAGLTIDNTEGTKASFIYASAAASKWKCGMLGSEIEIVNLSSTQQLTNKTLLTAVYNGTMTGDGIKDEDTMISNSAVHTATQQSIKAYVDNSIAAIPDGSFIGLTDVPASYASQAAKILTVNDGETAVSFRSLTGTSNQVVITPAAGSYTFALPQDIHSGASPLFTGLKLKEGSYSLELLCSSSLTANRTLTVNTNNKSITLELGTAEEGQALLWDNVLSKWKPGAAGDDSFKLAGRGASNDKIKIKGGALRDNNLVYVTDSELDNVWKSGLGVDIEYQIGATEIDTTPKANNTNYWLYINKTAIEALYVEYSAGNATAFQVKSVKSSSFAYSKDRPESGNVDLNTYIPVGYFRTDGSGNLATDQYSFSEVTPKTIMSGSGSGSAVPTGVIQAFGGMVAPDGYLLCNGSSVLVADYPNLYAVIGYSFGGSGLNFNVPQMTERFLKGKGAGAIGDTGGAAQESHSHSVTSNVAVGNITISVANLPSHNHTIDHTHTLGTTSVSSGGQSASHTHYYDHGHAAFTSAGESGHTHAITAQVTGSESAGHTHQIQVYDGSGYYLLHNRAGSSSGYFGRPGTEFPNAFGAGGNPTLTGSNTTTHTHSLTGNTASGSGHTHSITVPSSNYTSQSNNSDHTHSTNIAHSHSLSGVNSGNSGSGTAITPSVTNNSVNSSSQSINTLPPFLTVNFIIKT